MKKRKFIYINAHPDDDSMVAGTMAKLAKNNWDVYEFVCTTGKNANAENGENQSEIVENRVKEVEKFCELIGAKKPIVYENKGLFLDSKEDIITSLVKTLREIQPDVIVVQNDSDYHFEHHKAYQIGMLATEIAFRKTLPQLGDPLKNGVILKCDGLNVLENPLITFNISEVNDFKLQAIKDAYNVRLGDKLIQFSEGLSSMRGGRIGFEHAESFNLLNPTWYKFNSDSSDILKEFVSLGEKQ